MRILLAILFFISASIAVPIHEASKVVIQLRPTSDRIKEHGYPVEEHSVETTDGYVLKMFRIPHSHKLNNQDAVKPVIFMQHGLFSCSDAWVAVGPDDGLPFLLADLGYDVWLGNVRGNSYSRYNTRISVNNPRFWRFSWHEIGVHDISAMIDYILVETKQNALHYVGHSQGTSVFFVLMSMNPIYNEKIKTAHMLAPIAYMKHLTDKLVTTLAPYLGVKGIISTLFDSAQFLPRNDLLTLLGYNACGCDVIYPQFCSQYALIYEEDTANTNMTALQVIAQTHPAGASTKQILHYMQEHNSGHFRQYDFGNKKNLKQYGQESPPDYEVENIISEVYLYYSDRDTLAAEEDVLKLADRLPNLKGIQYISDRNWTHTNFITANEVKAVINDKIIEKISEYENKN